MRRRAGGMLDNGDRELKTGHCVRASVTGNILTVDGLDQEIRHNAAIVGVHARAIRVKDASNTDVHLGADASAQGMQKVGTCGWSSADL